MRYAQRMAEPGVIAMLFRKRVESSCSCCEHGAPVDEFSVICVKKGIVKSWDKCRRFVYDPLKREPEAPEKLFTGEFDEKDFEI